MQTPPPLSADDASLRAGLQFDASLYDANIYALSFIIGTRWPDSQGEPSLDFYKLSNVHNAPGDQSAALPARRVRRRRRNGRHARARRLPRDDHDPLLAGAGDAGPGDRRREPRRTDAAARIPSVHRQDADPGVRLLFLRRARRPRDPGQLHAHLPAHGWHRPRPRDHVDLQLGIAGARRPGRVRERPRPRDDPRRLRGRQPQQRRSPGLGDRGDHGRCWPR